MYTFYCQFSTRTDRKSVAKRAGRSKKPIIFCAKVSFIQWGINETITKLSWKFEENRTSGRFYFFKQKKNIRNGIHCMGAYPRDTGSNPVEGNVRASLLQVCTCVLALRLVSRSVCNDLSTPLLTFIVMLWFTISWGRIHFYSAFLRALCSLSLSQYLIQSS